MDLRYEERRRSLRAISRWLIPSATAAVTVYTNRTSPNPQLLSSLTKPYPSSSLSNTLTLSRVNRRAPVARNMLQKLLQKRLPSLTEQGLYVGDYDWSRLSGPDEQEGSSV